MTHLAVRGALRSVTSPALRDAVHALSKGEHLYIAGLSDEVYYLNGRSFRATEAVEVGIGSVFDVVVSIRPLHEEVIVVRDTTGGRLNIDRNGGTDPFEVARQLVIEEGFSVLVVIHDLNLMVADPRRADPDERRQVACVREALQGAATRNHPELSNTIIMISASAVFPWEVLDGIERVTLVQAGPPDDLARRRTLTEVVPRIHGAGPLSRAEVDGLVDSLVPLTQGLSHREIHRIAAFSQARRIGVADAQRLLSHFRYGEVPDDWARLRDDLPSVLDTLSSRVLGQPLAVAVVADSLAAAALGLSMSGKEHHRNEGPRLALMLVGPTGTGKTLLATVVTEVLFGHANQVIRIDCSRLAEPHALQSLVGSPSGYVGYEEGGLLTGPVMAERRRSIIFDEIDKAHPKIWTYLLPVLEEGLLRDSRGRVADFSESLVFFTANIGSATLAQGRTLAGATGSPVIDLTDIPPATVHEAFLEETRRYFQDHGYPEVYGRMEPGVVSFQPIRHETVGPLVESIVSAARFTHGPRLVIDTATAIERVQVAFLDPRNSQLGGRWVRNFLRTSLRRVASHILLNRSADADEVLVRYLPLGLGLSIDGGPERLIPDVSFPILEKGAF